ncbi:MAG: MoxR family ATPase [Candidatus Promineifilaceae bacterium]|nr:MoxR family ATPase [Candidatus Promineifilaceae bacterium]
MLNSIDSLQEALARELYIAERGLATTIYLSARLRRPIFLEGEPGVGKTEVAKVMASVLGTDLIRLQCYEGLDISQAVYEWNYSRQILHLRLVEAQGERPTEEDLFDESFLLRRPLLQAIENSHGRPPVLLIDEIDRSDEEFEAFLLEILSDFQITVPELGTFRAEQPPFVVLTSNRTREVHDALKRRCLYYWIDYPDLEKEMQIVRARVPEAPERLARQVTAFVQELREEDLYKIPGVAETIDWTTALVTLNRQALDTSVVEETLGVILKYQDDVALIDGRKVQQLLNRAASRTDAVSMQAPE